MLNCNFNSGDGFCEWNKDPRDQTAVWQFKNFGLDIGNAACMKPVGSKIPNIKKHSARLWSSWLNIESDKSKGLCLKFVYKMKMGRSNEEYNGNEVLPSLSLLKHSVG